MPPGGFVWRGQAYNSLPQLHKAMLIVYPGAISLSINEYLTLSPPVMIFSAQRDDQERLVVSDEPMG